MAIGIRQSNGELELVLDLDEIVLAIRLDMTHRGIFGHMENLCLCPA